MRIKEITKDPLALADKQRAISLKQQQQQLKVRKAEVSAQQARLSKARNKT